MLSSLNDFLVNLLGPFGPLFVIGFLGLALIIIALPVMLRKQRDRFNDLRSETRGRTGADKGKQLRTGNVAAEKLSKYAQFLEPQKEEEYSALRLKLLQAGYRDKGAVRVYHAAKLIFGIGFLVIGLLLVLAQSASRELSLTDMVLYTILPCAIGYYLPSYWVTKRQEARQTEITQGFPDALDMMLVCVEAGQSLDQSIIRVGKESRAGYPALADEFDLVANEVKAGKERIQVLKDMAERVGLPDVSSFVTTLVQSSVYGTSISEALRVYSADMRDKRVMRAEEKANLLPTKLTLGTMMFTVPPLLIILIAPSVHGIMNMMVGMSGP